MPGLSVDLPNTSLVGNVAGAADKHDTDDHSHNIPDIFVKWRMLDKLIFRALIPAVVFVRWLIWDVGYQRALPLKRAMDSCVFSTWCSELRGSVCSMCETRGMSALARCLKQSRRINNRSSLHVMFVVCQMSPLNLGNELLRPRTKVDRYRFSSILRHPGSQAFCPHANVVLVVLWSTR